MRRSRDRLFYFTLKITEEDYARVATHASVLNISIGEALRRYIRALPAVTPELVARWAAYRKQSGHDKVVMSLEAHDAQTLAAHGAVARTQQMDADALLARQEMEDAYRDLQRDEIRTQMKATELSSMSALSRAKRPEDLGSVTAVEKAELEELAEAGDQKAEMILKEIEAYKKAKERVEL